MRAGLIFSQISSSSPGVIVGPKGGLDLVALEGSQVGGATAGVVFTDLGRLAAPINEAGQINVRSYVTGLGVDASNDYGYFVGNSMLQTVAREGNAAPGLPAGVTFSNIPNENSLLNDAGEIMFTSKVSGSGVDGTNDSVLHVGGVGSLNLVAREGNQAAGQAAGVVYGDTFASNAINNAGQTAFLNILTGAGVNANNDRAIFLGGAGSVGTVVRSGDAAPGIDGGTFANVSLGRPALNNAGQTAFLASFTGPDVTTFTSQGIFTGDTSDLQLVLRSGEAAPGASDGSTLRLFGSFTPMINDAGQLAFEVFYETPGQVTRRSLVAGSPDNLQVINRPFDQAVGLADGITVGLVYSWTLNNAGQIAFGTFLDGAGVDNSNDFAYYVTDLSGDTQLVFREGDLFDVNDDPLVSDLRTIAEISLNETFRGGSGGSDGRANSFNDQGQLAFRLTFTDGSQGVFLAAVPEPSTALLVLAGFGCFISRRRRA